jgi:hypothetical protein
MGRRIFDWRFVVALAFMMLTVVACWGFVERNAEISRLINVAQRSEEIAVAARHDQADADARAAEQVAALRRQVADLKHQARIRSQQQAAQQKALLDYLHSLGITVPRTVYLTPRATGGGGGSGPKAPAPRHHPAPGSPGSTPAPTAPSADLLCELAPALCSLA